MKNVLALLLISLLMVACDDDSTTLSCDTLACGDHGTCNEEGDVVYCACDAGYYGVNCEACAQGYQDQDNDGSCLPSCETLGYTCSGLGSCSDTSGTALCLCEEGYEDNGSGECVPPPTGKTCGDPLPLALNTEFVASTVGAGNELDGTCVEAGTGADMIYTFTINGPRRIVFEANGFDTVIYLRTQCADSQSEVGCDDDSGRRNYAALDVELEDGTYFLVVDGFNEDGEFTFRSEVFCGEGLIYDAAADECFEDPCEPNPCDEPLKTRCVPSYPDITTCACDPGTIEDPQNPGTCIIDPEPKGESCLDALPLTDATGVITGTTVGSFGELEGSCGGAGNDHVFTFTITELSKVKVLSTGFDTVLHIRTDCGDPGTEIVCDDDGGGWQSSYIEMDMDPGTYFVILDSFEDPGDYEFSWSITPFPCAGEETICPGTPVCTPSADWKNYSCMCPEGMVPFENDCVDNPCSPNPCTDPGRGRCVAELPGAYTCTCEVGYVENPGIPGTCMDDPTAADWGIIVFLNADNNLEEWGLEDVDEMAQVGSSGQVDMVTLMDLYQTDGGVARVLYINQGSTQEVENYGEIDMSDWQVLRDFGIYAVQNYPARHYLFLMWDHGNGWYKSTVPPSPLVKGFSNDDHGAAGEISIANGDYARAMEPIVTEIGRPIDIIAFDACLMGMWEIAEATKPFANYLLASSETIPGTGFPYQTAFAPLASSPETLSATMLGTAIVDAYYNDITENSTLSLTDLAALDTLTPALSTLADALMANPSFYTQLEAIRQSTLWFSYPEHIDLYHFASQIVATSSAPLAVVQAASAILSEIDAAVLHHRAQSDYSQSHGLAIYLPAMGNGVDAVYQSGSGATWAGRSTWDEFVLSFAQ
ncbi:hypothetical protein KKF84_03090 [Myxococcota bacterium]|nr:hypothetical protein [Myxococcota bacterium]MBU1534275.1 hypothetical protein [Myxococcota bacterium]